MIINGETMIIYLSTNHSVSAPVHYYDGSNLLRISKRHNKDVQMASRIDFRIMCSGHDEP